MHSFKNDAGLLSDQIENLQELLGNNNIAVVGRTGGGNSVVYKVQDNDKQWALKYYPSYAPNQRDRLASELKVYRFLADNHVANVPLLKTFDNNLRWLIIEWIDGVIPQTYNENDIKQCLNFLENIALLNNAQNALNLPMAAEACLSLATLINQVASRYQRLTQLSDIDSRLNTFLQEEFVPVFNVLKNAAYQGYRENSLDSELDILQDKRSLIPADFGFHNTIKDADGRLYFFDFDYFGWDDPVKLLSDLLWHPKMNLSDDQKKSFISGLINIYKKDASFEIRFRYMKSLFGLRWVLILLNEFIPDFWQNRKHATAYSNEDEAKNIQLQRAKELLQAVRQSGQLL